MNLLSFLQDKISYSTQIYLIWTLIIIHLITFLHRCLCPLLSTMKTDCSDSTVHQTKISIHLKHSLAQMCCSFSDILRKFSRIITSIITCKTLSNSSFHITLRMSIFLTFCSINLSLCADQKSMHMQRIARFSSKRCKKQMLDKKTLSYCQLILLR